MSSEAKFTRGPWHRNVRPITKYPTIFAGRSIHIARVVDRGLGLSEAEANADLIAAAPELYQLAERVARLNPTAGTIGAGMLASLVEEAIAVLAKAQGAQA